MASVNKVILIGNIGSDPEVKFTNNAKAVCTLSLATNSTFKDESGETHQRTEWHRITVWGRQAENCGKYLTAGRKVYVEGRLQTRKWEDNEGHTRYTTEVVAHTVQFLQGGNSGTSSSTKKDHSSKYGQGRSSSEEGFKPYNAGQHDDDIPF